MTGAPFGLMPVLGAPLAAMPGMQLRSRASSSSSYAMSDNPFDIYYTNDNTYSETNHRTVFANSTTTTQVAKLLTGYGVSGQNRAIEFESMVLPGGTFQRVGAMPSLAQRATDNELGTISGEVAYRSSTGTIIVGGVTLATVATWTQGDKIGLIYRPALGTMEVFKNGASVYTIPGLSGDYTPACEGSGSNTSSLRVSTAWSYALPGDILYWR